MAPVVKTILKVVLVLLACGVVLSAMAAPGFKTPSTSPTKSKATPGVEAAKAISLITGVAISPLLDGINFVLQRHREEAGV